MRTLREELIKATLGVPVNRKQRRAANAVKRTIEQLLREEKKWEKEYCAHR
jgi:hypothetical protein